jgi:hypothetical protein
VWAHQGIGAGNGVLASAFGRGHPSKRPGANNPLKRSDSKVTVRELVQHCLSVCEILEVGDGWLVITFFFMKLCISTGREKKDGTRNQKSSKKRFDKSASRLGCFGRNSRLVVWA